jgi:hypothetical protein
MASSSYNKFYQFVEDLAKQIHDLDVDTLRVLLTNTAPSVNDTFVDTTLTPCALGPVSGAQEIAGGNGYTRKGNVAAFISGAQSGGIFKLVLSSPAAWIAAGGTIGPLRYAILYNDSASVPATRPVIAWWDNGSSITVQPTGEDFTLSLDPIAGTLTIQ